MNRRTPALRIAACISILLVSILCSVWSQNLAPPQENDAERDQPTKFNDHDRAVVRDWYNQHRNRLPPGFRDRDRLPPQWESRLQPGAMLDRNMRRRLRPVPPDLLRELTPAPRDYRYSVLDGHIILLEDAASHVSDVLHFHMDIGR
jgi:Ni/Co efflux regulator RcnB